MVNYPASLDNGTTLPNPTTGNNTNNPSHAGLHGSENAAIIATQTKLGTGSSVAAANQLLVGTGAGTSAWQGLTSAQLAAILSDETGTGSVVFANTPTLITPKVDTINENTVGNGVTVSSVNMKSGVVTGVTTLTSTGLITAGNGFTMSAGTATLPNGSLSTKALTNPHKFYIYRTAANTSSNTFTLVPYDTKLFDTGSNTDVTVNKGRFTAPVAGFYWFAAAAGNSAATATQMGSRLYKNGSAAITGGYNNPSNAGNILPVSGLIQLAATDYVEHFFIGGSGSTMFVGQTDSYFTGCLVSQT